MTGFMTRKNTRSTNSPSPFSPSPSPLFASQGSKERVMTRSEMEQRTNQLAQSLQLRKASAFSPKFSEKKKLGEEQRSNSFTNPSKNEKHKLSDVPKSGSYLNYTSPEKKDEDFRLMVERLHLSESAPIPDKDQPS